jgi:hypothetical protein
MNTGRRKTRDAHLRDRHGRIQAVVSLPLRLPFVRPTGQKTPAFLRLGFELGTSSSRLTDQPSDSFPFACLSQQGSPAPILTQPG